MAKKMTMLALLRHTLVADSVAKNKAGNYVFRKGYFYRHGCTTEMWEKYCTKKLADMKINATLVTSGDHWAPFRGGAPLARSSHWYAEYKIEE